ncbi:MAG: TetR/AcrR family transcriptional regulator [Oscillibacter sp.]
MRRVSQEISLQNERILEVAIQQFCEKGYAKTRMEDIAQILDITKTPLYYHFKDKAGLFDAAFRKAINNLYTNDAVIFAKNCCLYEKLVESFVTCAISSHQLQIDEMSRILVKEGAELSRTYTYQQEMQDRFYALKTAAMRDAQQRGEVKPDADIDELYAIINACYTGVLSWVGGEELRRKFAPGESERLMQHLIGTIYSAIKPLYFVA